MDSTILNFELPACRFKELGQPRRTMLSGCFEHHVTRRLPSNPSLKDWPEILVNLDGPELILEVRRCFGLLNTNRSARKIDIGNPKSLGFPTAGSGPCQKPKNGPGWVVSEMIKNPANLNIGISAHGFGGCNRGLNFWPSWRNRSNYPLNHGPLHDRFQNKQFFGNGFRRGSVCKSPAEVIGKMSRIDFTQTIDAGRVEEFCQMPPSLAVSGVSALPQGGFGRDPLFKSFIKIHARVDETMPNKVLFPFELPFASLGNLLVGGFQGGLPLPSIFDPLDIPYTVLGSLIDRAHRFFSW